MSAPPLPLMSCRVVWIERLIPVALPSQWDCSTEMSESFERYCEQTHSLGTEATFVPAGSLSCGSRDVLCSCCFSACATLRRNHAPQPSWGVRADTGRDTLSTVACIVFRQAGSVGEATTHQFYVDPTSIGLARHLFVVSHSMPI